MPICPKCGSECDVRLSPREKQVCLMTAQGLTVGEIATELGISKKTVATHSGRAHEKLGVHNKVELVLLFIRRGWMTPEGKATDELAKGAAA